MSFWNNKKVLVTGHTGFKGSWLSLWLSHLNADVIGVSLPPRPKSLYKVASIEKSVTSYSCDITDFDALSTIITNEQPEIVFHLAAQALVKPSYDSPRDTFSTNIMGTVNLLEALRHSSSVQTIIVVTSDKCYRNNEWEWGYRETDHLGGNDPYSSSKAATEIITESYKQSFFLPKGVGLSTVRAGNVIGGGDWSPDRLVPDLLRAYSNNQSIELRNPKATRPWQHVCEPLFGYLLLAKLLSGDPQRYSTAWNFGPPSTDTKSVLWIAKYLQKRLERQNLFTISNSSYFPEAHSLILDSNKAKRYLKWESLYSSENALDLVMDWYQSWLGNTDMKDVTLKQIQSYIRLVDSNHGGI